MLNPFNRPEDVSRHLKIAVTGKSGTGKTVFGLASRKHGLGKVAIISNEAGDVHYIKHPEWGEFDRLPTQRIDQLEQAIAFIEANPTMYGTLVIDTVTGVYEALVGALAKANGSVDVKSWGLIKRKWRSLMARLNNLPCNIVEVVHENDISETDASGKTTVVGQKLDAEKTFERNPDVLIRLGLLDGKRMARVLKDRTGTFQAGEMIPEPNIGMWAKAIKTGKAEARVETPEEVDQINEASISALPVTTTIAQETDADREVFAGRLIDECAAGFSDWEAKRAWSAKNKPAKDKLPEYLQKKITEAFKSASPVNKPTSGGKEDQS